MKKRQRLLSDEHWTLVEPLLPPPKRRKDKRGRPPAPNRACFEGIFRRRQDDPIRCSVQGLPGIRYGEKKENVRLKEMGQKCAGSIHSELSFIAKVRSPCGI